MKGFDKFQRAIIAATRKDFRLFLKDKKKFHLLSTVQVAFTCGSRESFRNWRSRTVRY